MLHTAGHATVNHSASQMLHETCSVRDLCAGHMHDRVRSAASFLCRYAVSELLPESGNAEGRPAAAGKGGPSGKGKDAATKPSAPLVPQGKAKAEALIAAGKQCC
jgi:hypothetical protein